MSVSFRISSQYRRIYSYFSLLLMNCRSSSRCWVRAARRLMWDGVLNSSVFDKARTNVRTGVLSSQSLSSSVGERDNNASCSLLRFKQNSCSSSMASYTTACNKISAIADRWWHHHRHITERARIAFQLIGLGYIAYCTFETLTRSFETNSLQITF